MDWKSEFIQEQIYIEQTRSSLAVKALANFVIKTVILGVVATTSYWVSLLNGAESFVFSLIGIGTVISFLFIAIPSLAMLRQARNFDQDAVNELLGETKQ